MVEISLPTKNAPNFQFTLAKNILGEKKGSIIFTLLNLSFERITSKLHENRFALNEYTKPKLKGENVYKLFIPRKLTLIIHINHEDKNYLQTV